MSPTAAASAACAGELCLQCAHVDIASVMEAMSRGVNQGGRLKEFRTGAYRTLVWAHHTTRPTIAIFWSSA